MLVALAYLPAEKWSPMSMHSSGGQPAAPKRGRPSKGDRTRLEGRVLTPLVELFVDEAQRTGNSQSDLLTMILAARYSTPCTEEALPRSA